MAVHIGSIRFRTGNGSLENLVNAGNDLFAAFEAVGMEPVSDEEYPGQCGTLVTEDPGVGETLAVYGNSAWRGSVYFNVYKHPNINLYIKANVYDTGFPYGTHRAVTVNYQLFWEIQSGVAKNPITVDPFNGGQGTSASHNSIGNITNSSVPLYASLSNDHFWISSVGVLSSSIYLAYNARYAAVKNCHSPISVFRAGDKIIISTAQAKYINAQHTLYGLSGYGSTNPDTDQRLSAARYWVSEGEGLPFTFVGGGSCGQLNNPQFPSTSEGLRVQRAGIVIAGDYVEPDFGFVSYGAVESGDLLTVDLDGAGPRKYRVAGGFGSQNSSPVVFSNNTGDHESAFPDSMFSVAILPWNE